MKRLALLSLALLCAAPASAQDRLAQRLDPATALAVRTLADSAAALALPVEPVVQKALEGATKGAPPAAIVVAARSLVRDLATARSELGVETPVDALVLAASALEAGMSSASLRRLRAHRDRPGFNGALAGIVYLLSRGVSADTSLGLVDAMLSAGLTQAEFLSLQRLVEQDVRGGMPSADAAKVRARALIQHGRIGPGGTRVP